MIINYFDSLFDDIKILPIDNFIRRFKNVSNSIWKEHFIGVCRKTCETKNMNGSYSNIRRENMSSKRIINRVVTALRKGQSLREIGSKLGLDSKAVWRLGDKAGVYSVRSNRY